MTNGALKFEWTQKLAVGNEILDMQHQEIFNQTNRLLDILVAEEPMTTTHEVFMFLDQYIENHFASEYAYMLRHEYPLFEEHKKLHEDFKFRYDEFKERVRKDGPSHDLIIDMESFLGSWLIHHIGEEDMKYVHYVASLDKAIESVK